MRIDSACEQRVSAGREGYAHLSLTDKGGARGYRA
jgi:hypothetical protein